MNLFLSSNTTLDHSRYYRAIILGCMDAVLTLPLSIFLMWSNAVPEGPVQPWPGWTYVHDDFSKVRLIPAFIWRADRWTAFTVKWDEWVAVFCAVVFFLFFGISPDTRNAYQSLFWAIASRIGIHRRVDEQLAPLDFATNQHATPTDSTLSTYRSDT